MQRFSRVKLVIIVLILMALVIAWASGLTDHFTLERLKEHIHWFRSLVQEQYKKSALIFIIAYTFGTVCMILPTTLFSLVGGFLFGVPLGYLYSLIGATIGALLVFWAARYLIGSYFQNRYTMKLIAFNNALEQEGWLYLIIVRLIPLIPFFLINVLAGLTKISTQRFVVTTAIGASPALFLFNWAGQELAEIHSLNDLIYSRVGLIFVGLILLSTLPLLYIRYRVRKGNK